MPEIGTEPRESLSSAVLGVLALWATVVLVALVCWWLA